MRRVRRTLSCHPYLVCTYDCSPHDKCSFPFNSSITYPWEVTKLALLHRLYLSFGPADSYCEFLIRLDIWIENSCAVQKFSLATMEHLKGLGTLFYVIDPYSTMYEKISDLPHPDFMSKVLIGSNSSVVQNNQKIPVTAIREILI